MNSRNIKRFLMVLSVLVIVMYGCADIPSLPSETASPSVDATTLKPGYLLKTYNGKIAVFVEGESVPKEIFEVYSDSLPESDREALKSGISARDDAELQRLIEDYTS